MSEPNRDVILIIEGVPTRDGRLIPLGVTTWRGPPLPIIDSSERAPVVIAAIRREGDRIIATLQPGGRAWLGDRVLCADALRTEIEPVNGSLEDWLIEPDVLLTFTRYEIAGATSCDPSAWPWNPS